MNYGISYMGSKTAIAKDIIDILPSGNRFVDLFGGGFAISHYVLLHHVYNNQLSLFGKKWSSLLYNDIDFLVVDTIKKAINGDYNYKVFKPDFIFKKDFDILKEKNGYVKTCWSFGNNGKTYMYSDEIVNYKYACHQAIVFDEWEEMQKLCSEVWEVAYNAIKNIKDIKQRRLKFAPAIVRKLKQLNDWEIVQNNPLYKSCHWRRGKLDGKQNDLESLQSLERLQSLESLESLERLERLQSLESLERLQRLERLQSLERLESLQSLERLERLQSLESLERLEITCSSYENYKYKKGDVVYCDIPYEDTETYSSGFNHKNFYEWAINQPYQIFFSSYDNVLDKRFKIIWQKEKRSSYSSMSNTTKNIECIYTNKE